MKRKVGALVHEGTGKGSGKVGRDEKECMMIQWGDKKNVLLKTLFDADERRKASDCPGVSRERVEEAMEDLDIPAREVHELIRELGRHGQIRTTLNRCQITLEGRRYIRENWNRGIKDAWEKHKKSKLEKLGEE